MTYAWCAGGRSRGGVLLVRERRQVRGQRRAGRRRRARLALRRTRVLPPHPVSAPPALRSDLPPKFRLNWPDISRNKQTDSQ